jgi:hypothetical protein
METIGLATIFGGKVQERLTREQFREAVERNKAQAEGWANPVCHTHDFCDANVLMLEAWAEMFGGEPDPASDEDAELINDAWFIAKAAEFFA